VSPLTVSGPFFHNHKLIFEPSFMSVSRRQLLKFASTATLVSLSPRVLAKQQAPARSLALRNLHTGEATTATYWADGQYQLDELTQLNRLLRDHRNDQITEMDPVLLDNIHRLQARMDYAGEIHIISGYRSPESNEKLRKMGHAVAKKSMHLEGRAIDLRLPNQALPDVHRAALNLRAGGVGYYPRSNFIHLDTGRVRRWG
jgi:uncharacterized protein YcbK (DUF882 family)